MTYKTNHGEDIRAREAYETAMTQPPASGLDREQGDGEIVADDMAGKLEARLRFPRSTPVQGPTMPKRFANEPILRN